MQKVVLLFGSTAVIALMVTVLSHSNISPTREPARSPEKLAFLTERPLDQDRHVHLMHLDGIQTRVFQEMLKAGQLPHFRFLIENGGSHFAVSTVDKSETMKVIPSILSAKVDTRLTAWWQFDRQTMGFRNFWIDPVEVVNYALGMEFPMYPTILDVVSHHGDPTKDLVSAFGLYRRGILPENYSRIYFEGYDAVTSHRYYRQAFSTTTELLAMLHRHALAGNYPKLTNSLLAPIDEMIHLNGITKRNETRDEYCFARPTDESLSPARDVMDFLPELRRQELITTQFSRVNWSSLCIGAPSITMRDESGRDVHEKVYPEVALAFIVADLNVGRLINGLREIRLENGRASLQKISPGLGNYVKKGSLESSAFEKTLFLIYGDHSMTNTFKLMNPPLPLEAETVNRHESSIPYPFSQVLAENFNLKAFVKNHWVGPGERVVLDYANLPPELARPFDPDGRIRDKATRLFAEMSDVAKGIIHEKYWYLFFLKGLLVDPKLNSALDGGREMALSLLQSALARGTSDTVAGARSFAVEYFNRNVGMVYGGGALNNAELFLPHYEKGVVDWTKRPSHHEILSSFNGQFFSTLMKTPGVGLVFVRTENAAIAADADLRDDLHIEVFDVSMNKGLITVHKDARSHQLVFHYKSQTPKDPLSYEALGSKAGRWGTYQEWNELSLKNKTFYHNVVAGIGSYLYSSSAGVGDVTIMHAPDWNFGENLAGHGGIETEEKLTPLIAFGPGIIPGSTLQSRCANATDGKGAMTTAHPLHSPTVLDIAPTAAAHLGYETKNGEGELTRFSRSGFTDYLRKWREEQIRTCPATGIYVIESSLTKLGYKVPDESKARMFGIVAELCHAIEGNPMPRLPNYDNAREDGCVLDISSTR